MGYVYKNLNPCREITGDCVIRAIAKAMGSTWENVYKDLCAEGLKQCDLPNQNGVWGSYLIKNGFRRYIIQNTCPSCYTVKHFCYDYPVGEYVLSTGDHAIAVVNGNYFDIFDSGDETVSFFYQKEVY